ncbi:MAG: hypothetical protein GY820_22825 [Gammaproteobacteria bacterium]|nr:hypothetical protein [Gammaproteobacteria bacterium]
MLDFFKKPSVNWKAIKTREYGTKKANMRGVCVFCEYKGRVHKKTMKLENGESIPILRCDNCFKEYNVEPRCKCCGERI